MLFIFVIAHFNLIASNYLPVPGLGWIGSSIHLLYGLDPFGSIIQHTFTGSKTSDFAYDISDVVVDVPNIKCSYSSVAFTAETYDEYQSQATSSFKINGAYKMFTGSYSSTSDSVKNHIYKDKKVANLVSADCVQYELNLLRSGAPLKSWFINEVKLLPGDIDTVSNLQHYFDFFNYYGTHIINRMWG
eukprot:UN06813